MPSSTPPGSEPSASPPGSPGPTSPAAEQPDLFTVSARVKNAIAIVITACWAGGIVADAALKDFSLSPFVYSTMLGLAASIFGSSFVKGFR
jgi:hypothetical protein